MEAFAETIPSKRKQERLLRPLHGRKAYRHFEDKLINLDVDEKYYAYRFLTLCKIAKEWCEDNEIPYTTREDSHFQWRRKFCRILRRYARILN